MKVKYNDFPEKPEADDHFITNHEVIRFKAHLLLVQNPDKSERWAKRAAKKWAKGGKR